MPCLARLPQGTGLITQNSKDILPHAEELRALDPVSYCYF